MDTEEPAGVVDNFGGPDATAVAALPTIPRVAKGEEVSPNPPRDWATESEELAEGEDLEDEGESGELAEGEDTGEPAIDIATGLERAKEGSSSVLQWDAETLNPTLKDADLKDWFGGLFNTFQPRWDGEIISLEGTPTIMSSKLFVVSNRNRSFREQYLDEIRYLVEERLYVAARLVKGNQFHAIREIPASLIGLKDRNGILGHAEERLGRDPDDRVAKTMIAAIQEWQDDLQPASNLGLYWGRATRSQHPEGKDDESTSSQEEDNVQAELPTATQEKPSAEAAGESPTPPAATPLAGDLLEVRVAALDTKERVAYLGHLLETTSGLLRQEERKLNNERMSRIKGANLHKLEAIACGAGEDPVPVANGPQPTTLLMQEPILHCCRRCGEVGDHTCEQYAKEPVTAKLKSATSYENLFSFAEGSIAAREADPIVPLACNYVRCYGPKDHAMAACPALHRRCPRCRCRGHTDAPMTAEGGGTIVACPQARGEDKRPDEIGPSFDTLHREFEDFADKGHLTKWRKLGYPGAGFFPARSLKGIRYLKTLGYKPLMRASTEKGILRCNEFFRDTSTMTGLGIQFEPLEDAELAEIERIRGKAPKPPSAKRQRFEQPTAPAADTPSEASTYSDAASAAPKATAATGPGPAPKPVKTKAERRETPPDPFRKPSNVAAPAPRKGNDKARQAAQQKYPPGHDKCPLYPTQGLKPSVRNSYIRDAALWERDHQRAAESEESSSSSPRKGRKPSPHPRDQYARNSGRSSDGGRTSDRSRSGHRGKSRSGSDGDRRRGGQDHHQNRQAQESAQRKYYALHNVPKAFRTRPAASGSQSSSGGSKAGASSGSSSTQRPSHQEVAGPKKGITEQTQAQLINALSGLGNVGDKVATGKQAETILRQFGAID